MSPIYTRASDGQIQGVGTGIFFASGRHAFVLTASHVLTPYINTDELLLLPAFLDISTDIRWTGGAISVGRR